MPDQLPKRDRLTIITPDNVDFVLRKIAARRQEVLRDLYEPRKRPPAHFASTLFPKFPNPE